MCRYNEALATIESLPDFPSSLDVMVMPGLKHSNQAVRVGEKALFVQLKDLAAFVPECLSGGFDDFISKHLDGTLRNCYQESSASFQPNGRQFRLNLDASVAEAHVQRHARLEPGLPSDLLGNHEAS